MKIQVNAAGFDVRFLAAGVWRTTTLKNFFSLWCLPGKRRRIFFFSPS
jgi:hypothetical protein